MAETRIILSGLWVAVMLTYLWGDVLRIFAGDAKPGVHGFPSPLRRRPLDVEGFPRSRPPVRSRSSLSRGSPYPNCDPWHNAVGWGDSPHRGPAFALRMAWRRTEIREGDHHAHSVCLRTIR